jgi:hypothetical protein
LPQLDSRIDLFERRLKAQSQRLKQAATELIPKGLRTPKGTLIELDDEDEGRKNKRKIDPEREVERLRLKVRG